MQKRGRQSDCGDGDSSGLPLARVRRLIKETENVNMVSAEAGILISRSTELFLELLSQKSGVHMLSSNRSKFEYQDLALCVGAEQPLAFLRDVVPLTVRAADIIDGLE